MKHSSDLAVIIHPARPDWSTRLNVAPQALPPFWRSWLLERGSLTARLSSLAPGRFSVDCQQEGIGYPTPAEQKELGLSANQRVWFREVQLKLSGIPDQGARHHEIWRQGLSRFQAPKGVDQYKAAVIASM